MVCIRKHGFKFPASHWLVLLTVCLLLCQSGCQLINRFHTDSAVAAPMAFSDQPTKEQLVAHLTTQSKQVKQLQSDVRVSMDGMPTLRGTLAVERPNRLRLNAGLLGVSELGVDVGSNDEQFWFWTKVAAPGEEPGIYYANHEEYRQSFNRISVPIEPSWLIDALGLMEFQPDDKITGPFKRPDGRLTLRTYRRQGDKYVVRDTAIDPRFGWVNQVAMYDHAGKRVAYANCIKHKYYPEHNVSLPTRIELIADSPTGSQLKIKVDASSYKLNAIYGDPDQLWSMPNPGNVPMINLLGSNNTGPSFNFEKATSSNFQPFDHRTSTDLPRRRRFGLNRLR